ncbi:hypothetical protein KZX37_02195 [Microbacterium sp. EYE_5]|uniref:hypothetical protein n=1 Tax=unclassified Microbacterium TaxID=2609290 RepID=UPI002004518F|nr:MULTISPECIES: hypothetical protein [unclassified Microbacterium]MCK6079428.1 hypothetical protein [Microbacterium sp. EYE_382]MCK6084698.1 hypothetical protein [Microbacterium sp. EYE_384]MCK6123073.1 hypothetical protein [Microbacterium sp. EYE_80]MCK6125462.1 hypothetical protein [Microbacterium sp. EYE_79]MCK6140382.1 hypothetical protein [Microbacterium sp. EYE_39]
MRCITYAGETVVTTDDVAEALVELTAAVAELGRADAVTIPIIFEKNHQRGEASLVIGVGNDVLSVATDWEGEEPDFSFAAAQLRRHPHYPREEAGSGEAAYEDGPEMFWDPDLDGFGRA